MHRTVIYCDRCGKEIKTGDKWFKMTIEASFNLDNNSKSELCASCFDWLKKSWFHIKEVANE